MGENQARLSDRRRVAAIPANTRYFADSADFATKKALKFDFREASGIPPHFLIKAYGFD